jgi:hypothetical protein
MKKIFLTGIYRSGTTLLDKLLNNHPRVSILSQPFSPLYFGIKDLFFKSKDVQRSYPVGPDFMDVSASSKELSHFLNSYLLTSSELDLIFQNVEKYKGQPGVEKFRSQLKEGSFIEIFEKLLDLLIKNSLKKNLDAFGVKEILCEEFIPDFIAHDIKCIVIIRDPRDIICSLNLGKGIEYTGAMRPILYSLRLWRKSVAYAINNNTSGNFMFIKYEDLVSETANEMNRITSFLTIDPFAKEEFTKPLKDQNQQLWTGNSSFSSYEKVSSNSVGRYKTLMSKEYIQYIENVCYPEMKYLGYAFENESHDINEIRSFKESFSSTRKNFDADFSSSEDNIYQEIRRIQLLKEENLLSEEEQLRLYLFTKVYNELKKMF